jgi:hypothetical protein
VLLKVLNKKSASIEGKCSLQSIDLKIKRVVSDRWLTVDLQTETTAFRDSFKSKIHLNQPINQMEAGAFVVMEDTTMRLFHSTFASMTRCLK